MKFLLTLFLLPFFLLLSLQSYSQGCSDAGVCSVGALGLAQYKYEKLPADKVKLELIEAEDTEIYTDDFDPKKSKKENVDLSDVTETIQKDTVVEDLTEQNKNIELEPVTYNIDSIKAKSNLRKELFFKSPKFILNYSVAYGVGDNSTSIITNQLEGNYRVVDRKLYAQIKVPYSNISGNLGNTNGIGDLTLSMSYIAINKKKTSLSFVGGVKIPTNNSNFSKNGKPLPMVYQTSLGSNDILLGANYRFKKWDFTLAYQHAFNANENEYLHSALNEGVYNTYFESNKFKRADDGVFRINRSYLFKKVTLTTGMLFIYHLKNDTYVNSLGNRVSFKDSEGLTLNLNFAAITPIYKKVDFTFIAAAPIVRRKARPDGLTREYVIAAGVKYNFY